MNIRSTRRWSKTGNLELSCTFPVGHIRVCTEECAVGHFSVEKFPLRNTTKELRQCPCPGRSPDDKNPSCIMKQPAWGFSRADQWPQGDKGMWDFRKNLGAWKSSFPFSRADPKWLSVKSVDPPPGVGWIFYGPGKDGCVRSFQISKKPITFLGSMIRHLTWLCRHIATRASRAHAQVTQSFFTPFFF